MSDRAHAKAKAWQPWRMQGLETESSPVKKADDKTRAQQKQRQQQKAQEAKLNTAYKQAKKEGYAKGFAEARKKGHQQGLEEGRQAARQELDKKITELTAPLTQLTEGLTRALTELDDQIGDALIDVALAASYQLASDALDARPKQVLSLIQNLLKENALFNGQVCLWLHPEDMKLIDTLLHQELESAGWEVKADESLTRGGCRVTGPEGELDATRETRWETLIKRVRRQKARPGKT